MIQNACYKFRLGGWVAMLGFDVPIYGFVSPRTQLQISHPLGFISLCFSLANLSEEQQQPPCQSVLLVHVAISSHVYVTLKIVWNKHPFLFKNDPSTPWEWSCPFFVCPPSFSHRYLTFLPSSLASSFCLVSFPRNLCALWCKGNASRKLLTLGLSFLITCGLSCWILIWHDWRHVVERLLCLHPWSNLNVSQRHTNWMWFDSLKCALSLVQAKNVTRVHPNPSWINFI